jgi:hypothetical protein
MMIKNNLNINPNPTIKTIVSKTDKEKGIKT